MKESEAGRIKKIRKLKRKEFVSQERKVRRVK
jgi:hypothetical protein